MQDTHDERRIPFDPEQAEPGLLAHWWAGIRRGLSRRNAQDTQQQLASARNRSLREQAVERELNQNRSQPSIVDRAVAVLGRIGRSSA